MIIVGILGVVGDNFPNTGRLQLFFDSPITAGASVACLLPWVYFFFRITGLRSPSKPTRLLRFGLVIVLAAALHTLALTQSRGPILASITACLSPIIIATRRDSYLKSPEFRHGMTGIAYLGLAVLTTGARGRLTASGIADDASIGNRLTIWRSATDLLMLKPTTGIGSGESGYIYSQWLSPQSLDYQYTGVFNLWLQIGIEHGLIAMTAFSAICVFTLAIPFFMRPSRHDVSLSLQSAQMSYLSFIVCSLTAVFPLSSLPTTVAIANSLLIFTLAYKFRSSKSLTRPAALAAILASSSVGILFTAGKAQWQPHLRLRSPNAVEIYSTQSQSELKDAATILVDRSILSRLYGKDLRRWLNASRNYSRFLILDPRYPPSHDLVNENRTVVLIGRAARFASLCNRDKIDRIIFVHPSVEPPAEVPVEDITVMLPVIDELGMKPSWEKWISSRGKLLYSHSNQDLDGKLLPL